MFRLLPLAVTVDGGQRVVDRLFRVVIFLLLCGVAHGQMPLRTWTSTSGKQVVARYAPEKRAEAGYDRVPLQADDGRQLAIPLASLSTADRQWLAGLSDTTRATVAEVETGANTPKFKAHPNRFGSEWTKLENCTLIDNPSNDGDSFHVKDVGGESIYRLYAVDTPESEFDSQMEDRIADQAVHFGITMDDSIKQGKVAAKFTEKLLRQPFTVITRHQNALGRSDIQREYAFIMTADGQDLGRLLLAAGMARAFGAPVKTGSAPASDLAKELQDIEDDARTAKLGIWAKSKPR